MDRRLMLHEELCDVLGSRNVYFQPPESIKLKYPCIMYEKRVGAIRNADNKRYNYIELYDVTVIDRDPDSTIEDDLVEHFQYCRPDRHYVADNLNHVTLSLYY